MTDQKNQDPDDDLLADLRDAVLSADPPPEGLRDSAIRALTWDTDMETLVAAYDSADQPTGMRSETGTRDLTFGRSGPTIDVTVTAGDQDVAEITGSIDAEVAEALLLQPGRERQPIAVDRHGRFTVTITGAVAGISVTTSDGRRVRTELFSLDPNDGNR